MRKNVSAPNWRVLWILLFLNIILLIFALFDQGVCYVVSSLLWSIGILIYHSKKLARNKKNAEDVFNTDIKIKRNRFISSKS